MFVKVCGITSEEDALLAVALGADAVGFIFAPSPRQIAPQRAAEIARRLPPEVLTVGVFRDAGRDTVVRTVQSAGLKAAQLHGHETPAECRFVRERLPRVIKVFAAGDAAVTRSAEWAADFIMLDAPSPGSGKVFDWSLAEGTGVPRLLLAGGLHPGNVAEAVAAVRPYGVCVDSGVEASPGRKDPVKMRAFIVTARAAEPRRYDGPGDGLYDWEEEQ